MGDLPLAAIIARQNLSVEEVWFLAVSLAFRSLPLIYFKGRNVLTRNTSCFFEIDSFLSCSVGTIERPIGYGSTVQSVCRVEKDSGRERVERDVSSIDQYEPCYIRLHTCTPGLKYNQRNVVSVCSPYISYISVPVLPQSVFLISAPVCRYEGLSAAEL